MFIRYKHHIFPFKVVIDRMVKWYGGSILVIGKKRLIIYGLGKIFEKNKKEIDWDQVVALTDKQIKEQRNYNTIPIICVEQIQNMEFDYIVIFTNQYFESIKVELNGKYFVPEEKIVSWRIFLEESKDWYIQTIEFYRDYINNKKINKALDIGMQYLPTFFFSRSQMISKSNFSIDGVGKIKYNLFKNNFYNHIYSVYKETENYYDMVLLWKDYRKYINLVELIYSQIKYILLAVPYQFEYKENQQYEEITSVRKIRKYLLPTHIIYEFEKKEGNEELDCEIFVVTHQKYNVLNNELYKPICVGKQYRNEKFLSEQMGDNIAYLNEFINECTALYWIWKNTNSKYVGLNHYRRYFYNNGIKNSTNYLRIETIKRLLEEGYDIILPQATMLSGTVLENIQNSVGKELSDKAWDIVKKVMIKYVPEYIDALDYVMRGRVLFAKNMFITCREILNSYCEWLFSFLIEATEKLDVSLYDPHRKRTIGYFAEVMWTVWLLKQELKIFELPITDI